MISLVLSLIVLLAGYALYGRFTERIFGTDDRNTPAIAMTDGVDCVPMKTWKAFLVQLLNIAGTGPIFGALMGAQFGPVVFLWIVFGSILGGAVHDFMSGMISCRNDGKSVAELAGKYMGKTAKWLMRVFSIVLLVLVGTVFVTSPADLLDDLTPAFMNRSFWCALILIYYILATLIPIDKLIGRLYPIFGVILMIMAAGILGCVVFSSAYTIPEITLQNLHPEGEPVWPFMFVTVACGAISGFHATQSPMIAKCIRSEKNGRAVFYGAMICEAVIALVWAAAGVAFYGTTEALSDALASLGQSGVVYEISIRMMGHFGGLLAMIGVVVCPITSGDTAFRGARLILAEWTGLDQKKLKNRLIITLPLLFASVSLTQLDFEVLWRYFSWSNQTLAMIALWIATIYLLKNRPRPENSFVTAVPAAFMSAVSATYILMSEEGFSISASISYPCGAAVALILFAVYLRVLRRKQKRLRKNEV